MIEQIMYLAIGFLLAMLCGLMVMPLVHNRAVRLTTRRLEAATPVSMAEIQADKDQLRAEFAMSARRLEITVDQLKHKTTAQLAEIGKKTDAINRLKIELGDKSAAIFALEAREQALKRQLAATGQDAATRTAAAAAAEAALRQRQSEVDKLGHALSDRASATQSRDAQIALLNAEITTLRARVEEAERDYASAQHKLAEKRGDKESAARELGEARGDADGQRRRADELERELAAKSKAADEAAARVTELEERLARQGKLLAQREYEAGQLRQEMNAAAAVDAATLSALRAEKAALEEELRAGKAKAQHEAATAPGQPPGDGPGAGERMENAQLRERINDIAAEVAKLASTIEGPNSPIQTILASEPAAREGTANGTAAAGLPPGATLADRIRALQAQAARASQAG